MAPAESPRRRDGNTQSIKYRPGIGQGVKTCIPLFISGTADAMPIGRPVPVRSKITVRFSHPVRPGLLDDQGKGETLTERIADALHRRVAATAPDKHDRQTDAGNG